jgi:preprotein translocase subunit YajC
LAHFLLFGTGRPLLLAQAAGGGGGFDSLFSGMAIPLMLTLALMYLFLMRPEQKKRKEMEKLLSAIKKNDHVVTIGGIFGTVVLASPGSESVVIRVDDSNGTKLKVLRSAISRVGGEEAAEAEGKVGE